MSTGKSARSLEGEVAIVTGGSMGIGRAIVELFAQEGASVMFCARGPEGEVMAERLGDRHPVAFRRCDVTSEPDVAALVEACAARFGTPSLLVNSAGVGANPGSPMVRRFR